MQTQKISFLYKFYCWGWRNASLRGFSLSQHWLLSIFLHYRRGFAEGSAWVKEYYSEYCYGNLT
jgi:hypothetical protein